MNFITKRHSGKCDAYGEIGYSPFGHRYVEGAVGGPFSASVRGRISARWEDSDAGYKNCLPGGKNTYQKKYNGVCAQLEADLGSTLTARLSFTDDKTTDECAGIYKAVPVYYVKGSRLCWRRTPTQTGWARETTLQATGTRSSPGRSENSAMSVASAKSKVSPTRCLDRKPGAATLVSITNYTHFKIDYNEGCAGGPVNYCNFPIYQDLKQSSQELHANETTGNATWMTGLCFLNTDQDVGASFAFPVLAGTDFVFSDANPVNQKLTSYATFGQMEYKLPSTLASTERLPYTHDKKTKDAKANFNELGDGYSGGTGSTIFYSPLLTYGFSAATVGNHATVNEGMWSGKVQMAYRPVERWLFLVSVSRGVQSPEFNTNASGNLTNPDTPFESGHLIGYETGAKLEFLDKRVQLISNLGYYDYRCFPGLSSNDLQGVAGRYNGNFLSGELEFVAIPAEHWLLRVSASYMSSTLKNIPTAYNGIRDQQNILAPRWTTNGSIRKAVQLAMTSWRSRGRSSMSPTGAHRWTTTLRPLFLDRSCATSVRLMTCRPVGSSSRCSNDELVLRPDQLYGLAHPELCEAPDLRRIDSQQVLISSVRPTTARLAPPGFGARQLDRGKPWQLI